MKYDGAACTGVMLVLLLTTSVMAGSNLEFGGKLYQFRDAESEVDAGENSGEKPKFRPLRRHSGSQAPVGRNIGGATAGDQGYVFRPLRNRTRWVPGSEPEAEEDLMACPVEEDGSRRDASPPAYSPYRSRQRYEERYRAPVVPPPGGYLNLAPGISGYPY